MTSLSKFLTDADHPFAFKTSPYYVKKFTSVAKITLIHERQLERGQGQKPLPLPEDFPPLLFNDICVLETTSEAQEKQRKSQMFGSISIVFHTSSHWHANSNSCTVDCNWKDCIGHSVCGNQCDSVISVNSSDSMSMAASVKACHAYFLIWNYFSKDLSRFNRKLHKT